MPRPRDGIRVERMISDNAFNYRRSRDSRETVADLGIVQKFIRPYCPWSNGKVERLNRTLATEWATPKYGPRTANAPQPCQPGSRTTPWNTPTSASADSRPSTASTTLRVNTHRWTQCQNTHARHGWPLWSGDSHRSKESRRGDDHTDA